MSKFLLTAVCASFGLLLSSASAQEEAKDEAWRLEGVQKLEFTHFAAAGKKVTLDFGYALNSDCSPVEGSVEVKTTAEPAHGAIEVVSGHRFPNYAKTNVRFKCNEKKPRGLLINYKSKEGYVGPDAFDILVPHPAWLRPRGALQRKCALKKPNPSATRRARSIISHRNLQASCRTCSAIRCR